jgi:hypothetical protein
LERASQAASTPAEPTPGWLFPATAAAVIAFHAILLFSSGGLHGSGDLIAHLRMIELMGMIPALRNVYPPGYHVVGALLSPVVGLAVYPKLFAVAAAALSIGCFRFFQKHAGLPDYTSVLFALWPYSFALSWSMPKVEVAGFAMLFLGLGLLLSRRYLWLALALGATFWLHTSGALLFGFCCGVLALARRDLRGLAALAVGTLGGVPLIGAHLAAGCSLQQALLFSEGDYLHVAGLQHSWHRWPLFLALASPPMLIAALPGAKAIWTRDRGLAVLCGLLVVLYLQELWLAPFGVGTTVNLNRGLSLLVIPVAISAGLWLAPRRRLAPWLLGATALWCVGCAFTLAREPIFWRPVAIDEIRDLRMARCRFGWNAPHSAHRKQRRPRPPVGRP